jgi:hypothetical protein
MQGIAGIKSIFAAPVVTFLHENVLSRYLNNAILHSE